MQTKIVLVHRFLFSWNIWWTVSTDVQLNVQDCFLNGVSGESSSPHLWAVVQKWYFLIPGIPTASSFITTHSAISTHQLYTHPTETWKKKLCFPSPSLCSSSLAAYSMCLVWTDDKYTQLTPECRCGCIVWWVSDNTANHKSGTDCEMSCIYYKFKASNEFDTIKFDGLSITLADVKNAISQQKKLAKGIPSTTLQIIYAQTDEGR